MTVLHSIDVSMFHQQSAPPAAVCTQYIPGLSQHIKQCADLILPIINLTIDSYIGNSSMKYRIWNCRIVELKQIFF